MRSFYRIVERCMLLLPVNWNSHWILTDIYDFVSDRTIKWTKLPDGSLVYRSENQ